MSASSASENPGAPTTAKARSTRAKSSSTPNASASAPSEAATYTPARAKSEADAQQWGNGRENTASSPFSTAARARTYLSAIAASPRCTASPLITPMTASYSPLSASNCFRCPKWKGLYSQMTAAARNGQPLLSLSSVMRRAGRRAAAFAYEFSAFVFPARRQPKKTCNFSIMVV